MSLDYQPDELRVFNPDFVRKVHRKRRRGLNPPKYGNGRPVIWTEAKLAELEMLMRRGLSAGQIGLHFNRSADFIRGLINRKENLRAIGLVRSGKHGRPKVVTIQHGRGE